LWACRALVFPEGWLRFEPFRPGVDALQADFGILGPGGDKAPLHEANFKALAAGKDHGRMIGWPEVLVRLNAWNIWRGLVPNQKLILVEFIGVTAAHLLCQNKEKIIWLQDPK
jgi:hypothetical protein